MCIRDRFFVAPFPLNFTIINETKHKISGINLKASHSGQESKIFRILENGWGHLTILIIIIDKTKLIIVTTMTQR